MLIGEYIHTLDPKNRLSLPAKFRQKIGKKMIITPGLDNCLFLFTEKEWQKISDKLSEFSLLQSDNRSFNRFMFAGAVEAAPDKIGRILIPDFLKEYASLKNKIAVIGVQTRIEIWDEEAWRTYKKSVNKEADQLAERLGQIGVL